MNAPNGEQVKRLPGRRRRYSSPGRPGYSFVFPLIRPYPHLLFHADPCRAQGGRESTRTLGNGAGHDELCRCLDAQQHLLKRSREKSPAQLQSHKLLKEGERSLVGKRKAFS
ncbi:hypothetical protein ROHU_017514 [Labeo rohita]|uniref:Uncharacterized protein n=1 Tax=Labeo rohita TaxID=84645 RepID=A0A498NGH8_LABRO|nr:hypothetical protein ROHU_017514 [Labeo rohita]